MLERSEMLVTMERINRPMPRFPKQEISGVQPDASLACLYDDVHFLCTSIASVAISDMIYPTAYNL